MKKPMTPPDEQERLCSLYGLDLLDTAPEERFDRITDMAIKKFNVPISTIALIDKDREWFKSVQGLPKKEGPRDTSFCGHALIQEYIMIVSDTLKDERFLNNPQVINPPYIRFYAGKSLYERKTNKPVGVFCVKDYIPRVFNEKDIADFIELAILAEDEINQKP